MLGVGNTAAFGSSAVVMKGGALDLSAVSGGFSIGEISGDGRIAMGGNAVTLGASNTNDTLSADLADGGDFSEDGSEGTGASLVKIGNGALTLSGNNTYTGGTTIASGTLVAGSSTAFGTGSLLDEGSTLDLSGVNGYGISIGELSGTGELNMGSAQLTLGSANTSDTLYMYITDGGIHGGSGASLVKVGTGTLTLVNPAGYSGTTTVSGGTLAVTSSGALGSSAVVMNGGKLDLSGVTGGFSIGEISGSGTVAIGSNALTLGAAGTARTVDTLDATLADGGIHDGTGASLIKAGPGTLILTANNTFTGTTVIDGGTLLVSSDASLGTQGRNGLTIDGGVFGYNSDPDSPTGVQNTITGNIVVGRFGSGLEAQNVHDILTIGGNISGGSLTAAGAGTVILDGSGNTYSGGTTVGDSSNQTTLNVGDTASGTSSSLGSGAIANNGILNLYAGSSAGSVAITNYGSINLHDGSSLGSAAYGGFGYLSLFENASLGGANISSGNLVTLNGYSTAATATVTNNYGSMFFNDYATGGAATGDSTGNSILTNLGILGFTGHSNAEGATISNLGHYASLFFQDNARAGSATITNEGNVNFYDYSSACSANITSEAYFGGDPNNGTTNASITFSGHARAGSATIVSNGPHSLVSFQGNSDAETATITNNGGLVDFADQAIADNATIVNNAASYNGVTGGAIDLSGIGNGNTLSIGSLSGSGDVDLGGSTLMLGNRNTNDTISGTIRDEDSYGENFGAGSLVKIGTGTLTLTGTNTFSGGTTINSGTVVASGTGLGTGLVTVSSGGTLAVGTASNTTNASQLTGSLTIGTLSIATTGSGVPALTFNLAPGSTSDMLTITGTGTDVFATTGAFEVGFSSASGSDLAADSFTLITFTGQTTTDNLPSLTDFLAAPTGNLQTLNTSTNAFQYVANGSGQETLVFLENGGTVIRGSDAMPEPSSLGLVLLALLPIGAGYPCPTIPFVTRWHHSGTTVQFPSAWHRNATIALLPIGVALRRKRYFARCLPA